MNAFTRKTLIFACVMVVVGFGSWFGRKFYLKAVEHRLVAEAGDYIQKKDFNNASLCLQRALQLKPYDPKVNALTADLLEETGSPGALGWRVRAAQLQTNNIDYRFAWAKTALESGDVTSAAQALAGVDQKYRSSAAFHKLAGALAWNVHDLKNAEDQFQQALKLEPANQSVVLNLATVRLVSTNQTVAGQARLTLEQIPAKSPLRLTALRYLIADSAARKSFARALAYSQETIGNTNSTYSDKLVHLQLLREAQNPAFDSWLATLKAEAGKSPNHAYALGHWMQTQQSPTVAFQWLHSLPNSMQTNQPVPLAVTDALAALKNWRELLAVLQKQDWGQLDFYRYALTAMAERSLGNNLDADNAWQVSLLQSSDHLDRLARLDALTATWNWAAERSAVLQKIISNFPRETWAGEQLLALLYAEGKTKEMADVLGKMHAANPSDIHIENDLATALLLLKSNLSEANQMALEVYKSATNNPFCACTYSYSLVLQSKPREAAKVLDSLKAEYLKNPSIAAYYGVVQVAAGNSNAARGPLQLAVSAKLLPEEMQLVRRAQAQIVR